MLNVIPYKLRNGLYNVHYVDEVHDDLRKGKSQTYFVVEIKSGDYYWDTTIDEEVHVPEECHGYWRTRFPTDNECTSYTEAWYDKYEDWIRCTKKEKVVITWEEV